MHLGIYIFSSKKSILKTQLFEKGIKGKYLSYFPPKTTYASDWLTSLVSQSEASFLAGNSFYIFPPCPFQKTVLYLKKISSTTMVVLQYVIYLSHHYTEILILPYQPSLSNFVLSSWGLTCLRGGNMGDQQVQSINLYILIVTSFKILEKNFSVILWPNSPASNGWNIHFKMCST